MDKIINLNELNFLTQITVSEAKTKLYRLLDEVAVSHKPVQITGKSNSAILISDEDWQFIQETLYLTSIPGMRESIIKGINTPVEKCYE
jgi:prevent-host-death family protein